MKKVFTACLLAVVGVLTLSAQSANDNAVMKSIMERRSIRKYLDKPVEHKKLEAVALAGINAPSAMNRQNWAVRIIEDQKLMADVKDMCRNAPNLICVCAPANGNFDTVLGRRTQLLMAYR